MAVSDFDYYLSILNSHRDCLLAAQKVKDDPAYKKAMNYMRTQKIRGRIKEVPTKENGFSVEV